MPQLRPATPRISVRLYKTISRKEIDGQSAVSARYEGKAEYIDLTPFLGEGSSVTTTKSVRDPAGAFSITFADRPHQSVISAAELPLSGALESIYGLVEPMDVVEIRMWGGVGPAPAVLPIKMRGFVSGVQRAQTMGSEGRPVRQVVVKGQDYGKIWQIYQILALKAYAAGNSLLTSYKLWEQFGIEAVNTMKAADLVILAVEKILNPFIAGFMPKNSLMPSKLLTDDILVKHGKIGNVYQDHEGTVYDMLKYHGDVGFWNELYTEDREDGVHVVYRPVPALRIAKRGADITDLKSRIIQDDAPPPSLVSITDSEVQSISAERSDEGVANFFWVNNARYDLVDEIIRKLDSLQAGDSTVSLSDYPNAADKYYGTRPMYAATEQSDDAIEYVGSGLGSEKLKAQSARMEDWFNRRRRILIETNKDNVVLERGSARIKGGPMRPDGKECMKAGDYAKFTIGTIEYTAYVVQITDEFQPFAGYTTTLQYERGEGFSIRAQMGDGVESPWLAEQSSVGLYR